MLGQGEDLGEARTLVERYRRIDTGAIQAEVAVRWKDILGTVRVKTPDRSFDLIIDRWLSARRCLPSAGSDRVLSVRRSLRFPRPTAGCHGAGDAGAGHDQRAPFTSRQSSIRRRRCAPLVARPSGKGVRTRISDDYLWLPYAVAHYVDVTGDQDILEHVVPYLRGVELAPDQDEIYLTQRSPPRKEPFSTTADVSRPGALQAGESWPSPDRNG